MNKPKVSSKTKIHRLIDKLDTPSDKSAERIILQLVEIGKESVPPLIRAAKNKAFPRIRKWSLQALGALGDKRAGPLLIDALHDSRMTVRLHALKGLSKMKDKKGLKKIVELLKDESGGVRVNALYTLTAIGDRSVVPQVLTSLSDAKWYVRQNACVAIGRLGGSGAKKKLVALAKNDQRAAVRKAAKEAIERLGLIKRPVKPKKLEQAQA